MEALPNGLYLLNQQEAIRMETLALVAQRFMWRKHEDEIVGIPDVEPCCNMIMGDLMKVDRTTKRKSGWSWLPCRVL